MPDSRETVDLIVAGYEWICIQCDHTNTEIDIPNTRDLTCFECGCNYLRGEAIHVWR